MPSIGIIAEGVTDQQVLERFLRALYDTDTPQGINFLQPQTSKKAGNWDKVFDYIASQRFRDAFQTNDFVVIQIDTDVCDRFTPPIARTTEGEDVPAETLIEQVRQHLIAKIDSDAPGYYERRKAQIIFAVAVHSLECWILPLYCDQKSQKTKRDNCLNSLNHQLETQDFSIDKEKKGEGYNLLFRHNKSKFKKLKRETVLEISKHNPGFADFVVQTEALLPTE